MPRKPNAIPKKQEKSTSKIIEEKIEKEIADLDKKINELNVKNGELTSKMDIYNKEGPKLIQKSYEPLSNQKNLQDLEEKLKIFKKEYEMTKNEHEGKQSTIQSELDKQKIQIEESKPAPTPQKPIVLAASSNNSFQFSGIEQKKDIPTQPQPIPEKKKENLIEI